MNLSGDTKKILCAVATEKKSELSLLSAVIHTCSVLSRSSAGTRLTLTSTNADLHTLVASLIESTNLNGGVEIRREGRDTVLCGDVIAFLEKVKIVSVDELGNLSFTDGIAQSLISSDEKIRVYLRGAFLGAGSFSSTSWHLEIGVSDEGYAEALKALIVGLGLSCHTFSRKDKQVVYLKKREDICDFFGYIGATKTMLELIDRLNTNKTRKDAFGKTNLELSNLERTINVGVEQIEALRLIESKKGLATLDDKLYEVAKLRLESSELSYDDMAAALGISKGSVKYRLKKIMELAQKLKAHSSP